MQVIPSTNRYSLRLPFFFDPYFVYFCCCLGLGTMAWAIVSDTLTINYILNEKMHRIQKVKWKIEWIEIRFGTIGIALQWMKQYVWIFFILLLEIGARYVMLSNWINTNARVHWPPNRINRDLEGNGACLFNRRTLNVERIHNKSDSSMIFRLVTVRRKLPSPHLQLGSNYLLWQLFILLRFSYTICFYFIKKQFWY